MTKEEWLKIGYQNGLIELEDTERITFHDAYLEWFKTKCRVNRPSTMDRIEVTYRKHYEGTSFIEMYTSNITEKDMISFLSSAVTKQGSMSPKEYERIYQILHSVLLYLRDMNYEGIRLYDWELIKRNIPRNKIVMERKSECALSKAIVACLLDSVINKKIYPDKQSACLCLCLNFYLGLRIGELSALKFSDFDLQSRTVKISCSDSKSYERDSDGNRMGLTYKTSDTKTPNGHRIIPLLPEAVYIYENIKLHHQTCRYNSPFLVFDGADTNRTRSLDRTLRRLCSLCEITYFNTHIIRKTFASMLHHSNVPTRAIADLMGHAEIGTTEKNYILSFHDNFETYFHYMKDSLKYN